jgi:AAA family ATP:ADP antiporter
LAEGPWKAKAATLYTTPEEYAVFVGSYLSYTGLFTIMFVLLGSNIVRFLGWYAAAIITPLMVFITGVAFFGFSSLDLSNILGIAIENPLTLAITMGAIQNVLSKSSKYTLFDSTKEMAYVPLEDGLKTRGKAAVDVVGIKLGKSISAFLQVTIFTLFPAATYGSISLYLMGIFSIVCIVWIWAVKELSREYDVAVKTTGH